MEDTAQLDDNTVVTDQSPRVVYAGLDLDKLDPIQVTAVNRCIDISPNNRIVPITGVAGTGKTSIMKMVYNALVIAGHTPVVCAPTGKASKRIHEATGIPRERVMTIHRLLEYPHPGEKDAKTGKPLRASDPKRCRHNPIEFNVVLCDEYAMVNHEVHRNLLDALPVGGCIRMFGDVNQLPPIEHKSMQNKPTPFQETIAKFKGVILETIHRHGEGSSIVQNGARILSGRMPNRHDDFTVNISANPVEALKKFVIEGMDNGIDFSRLDFQIMSPTRKGWSGSVALNAMLQTVFRPENDGWLELPRHSWAEKEVCRVRKGDKVIWMQNNYDLEIFNGETGIVEEVTDYGEVAVDWGDRVAVVPPVLMVVNSKGIEVAIDPRKDMELAYVVTTHKAQGSEYRHIAYIAYKSMMWMCNRNNFYTAVTRAREAAHIFIDQTALAASCRPPRKG